MKFERIQQLRLVAVTVVVAFHAFKMSRMHMAGGTRLGWLIHGDLGVDLFFVISGFIICYTASRRERDWRLFLRQRLTRIVPLYWLLTALMLALIVALPHTLGRGGQPTIGHVLLSFGFGSFLTGRMPLVYVGWSLEYEMLFYLAGAAAMAGLRRPWRWLPILLALVVAAGAVARPPIDSAAYALARPMLLEFAMGVLIGSFVTEGRVPWPGIAAVGAALLSLAFYPLGQEVWRVWFAGIAAAGLLMLAIRQDRRAPVRSLIGRIAATAGDAAYSIYLIQVLSLSAFAKLAARLAPGLAPDLFVLLATAGTIAAGIALHRLVEQPLLHLLRRRADRDVPPVPQAASSSG